MERQIQTQIEIIGGVFAEKIKKRSDSDPASGWDPAAGHSNSGAEEYG